MARTRASTSKTQTHPKTDSGQSPKTHTCLKPNQLTTKSAHNRTGQGRFPFKPNPLPCLH